MVQSYSGEMGRDDEAAEGGEGDARDHPFATSSSLLMRINAEADDVPPFPEQVRPPNPSPLWSWS